MTRQDCEGAIARICQALPPHCRTPGVTSYCVYYQHGQAALLPISCAGTPAPVGL
ncbi:MAG: hypothetical protein M5U20_05715 [Phycisphaerales bacterium]|nr:hypothetical protein [Phycisphaerales bacterium]